MLAPRPASPVTGTQEPAISTLEPMSISPAAAFGPEGPPVVIVNEYGPGVEVVTAVSEGGPGIPYYTPVSEGGPGVKAVMIEGGIIGPLAGPFVPGQVPGVIQPMVASSMPGPGQAAVTAPDPTPEWLLLLFS